MAEELCWIQGPPDLPGPLEGRLSRAARSERGLVAAHPHPLYGGSLDNNVVEALVQAGRAAGLTTLRFNFRGVGRSAGRHGHGREEAADILAAVGHLAGLGLSCISVAGYSFGAWAMAQADWSRVKVAGLIWVAPPLGLLPVDLAWLTRPPDLILAGGRDQFCPRAGLDDFVRRLSPCPKLILSPSADHFFGGFEHWIEEQVRIFLGQP